MQLDPSHGAHARSPKRPSRRLASLLLLIPVLVGSLAAPAAPIVGADELADAKAQQRAIEQRIAEQKSLIAAVTAAQQELRGQIQTTTAQLKGIAADLGVMREKIATLITEIDVVRASYERLVAELEALDVELVRIEAEETAKKAELREREALLAERIRAAYDDERTSLLETVLSGDSFADVLTEMSYQLDVAAQDRALAERIRTDRETLAALHRTVELTRAQTNLLRQETAAQKRELDARLVELKEAQAELKRLEAETKKVLSEQKAAYERLARDKANLKRALANAAAAKRRLQSRINSLIAQQLSKGNIPSQFNGTLQWPMAGSISGDYGCSSFAWYGPGNGCLHFHNGIDIVAPYGTAVKAAGPGRVVYCGWNYADGADPAWIVVVAHSESLQTWYAHLQAYQCPQGEGSAVRAGEVIGYEGNTGKSTGAHLHWMVLFNGDYANPRLFV